MKPPTIAEIALSADGEGIHTFANGTEWEMFADRNCLECRFYELDGAAGELCGFEGAALIGRVTPELATKFGWVQRETKYGPRSGWDEPAQCAYFKQKRDPNDGSEEPTPICPSTLSLFADQRTTRDIAAPLEVRARVFVRRRDGSVAEIAGGVR